MRDILATLGGTVLFIFIITQISQCDGDRFERERKSNSNPIGEINGVNAYIIIIDSCEYVKAGCGNTSMLTHKGNCKYCIERNKLK